jgi:hypothetical protein
MKLSVHVFNGLRCDYKRLTLSLSTGDNYGLFIQKLYQELINELAMSRWTGHVGKTGMVEFHSQPALFLIPDDAIDQLDFDIINILTQGLYGIDVKKALHSLVWSGVHRYINIKDILNGTKCVDIVACFSGEPRNTYQCNDTYKNHVATTLYWADIDTNRMKMILSDDLRRRVGELLDVEQAIIPSNKFIHAPRELDTEFVDMQVLSLLKMKCGEELVMREKFNI